MCFQEMENRVNTGVEFSVTLDGVGSVPHKDERVLMFGSVRFCSVQGS